MKTIWMFAFIISTIWSVQAQNATKIKVAHEMAALPYAYDALEKAIDKETMEIHYDRHYRGYYNKFLKAIEGTDLEYLSMNDIFAHITDYPEAVRNNAGGYFNHAMYWTVMSPDGGTLYDHDSFWSEANGKELPNGKLIKAIEKSFGSFEAFKKEFADAGAKQFGSGWAWLCAGKDGKLFVSSTANQNNPLMNDSEQQGIPILCMDVWEHAYYLRYQNKRSSYIENFWSIVNWNEVAKRYAQSAGC